MMFTRSYQRLYLSDDDWLFLSCCLHCFTVVGVEWMLRLCERMSEWVSVNDFVIFVSIFLLLWIRTRHIVPLRVILLLLLLLLSLFSSSFLLLLLLFLLCYFYDNTFFLISENFLLSLNIRNLCNKKTDIAVISHASVMKLYNSPYSVSRNCGKQNINIALNYYIQCVNY